MEILPEALPEKPARRFVEALGCRMAYLETGEGAPVVLLHGALDTADAFRFLIEKLAPYRRVLALDLPGCGESAPPPDGRYGLSATARYIAAALDALEVGSFAIIGQERGGALASLLGLLEPVRVRALCLLSASLKDTLTLPFFFRFQKVPPVRWLAPYLLGEKTLRALLRARYDLKPPFFPARLARLSAHLDLPRRRAQLSMLSQEDPEEIASLVERLPDLEVPTLLLQGNRDRYVSIEDARQLSRLISTSHLFVIERCGHSPHEETPQEASRRILDWLARWGA